MNIDKLALPGRRLPITAIGLLVPVVLQVVLLVLGWALFRDAQAAETTILATLVVSAGVGFIFVAERVRWWQASLLAVPYLVVILTLLFGLTHVLMFYLYGPDGP